MLEIKNNVVISTNVTFVLHDFSISRVMQGVSNIFGKIVIGNNCFIGANSTIIYGVELADNTIVAAGSVVTKSFQNGNVIIGGNPAKIIGTWDDFRKKAVKFGNNAIDVHDLVLNHPELLLKK